jgi:glutamate-1-semialdehyde 2,1-aminomutase
MISKFKQVIVFASIDGLGDVQEYLRYPSNWQQIRKNLLAFAELPNVKIEVSPVIQIANIGKITEFFDYILQLQNDKINLYPIVLFNPDYLSIANLPKELLLEARELANNFEEQKYFSILNEVFDYTKKNLTTKSVANYIISKL